MNNSMKNLHTLMPEPDSKSGDFNVEQTQEWVYSQAGTTQPQQSYQHHEVTNYEKELVNSVFAKLQILFPVAGPKADQVGVHKVEWLKTFAVQKVNSEQLVQIGLNRARSEQGERIFWPSPRQFCSWCFSDNSDGLPRFDKAFREALKYYRPDIKHKHKWSHVVVRLAVEETGQWLFARGTEQAVRDAFERHLMIYSRRFKAGEDLAAPIHEALPMPGKASNDYMKNKRKLAEFRDKLNLQCRNG
ncbi:replication protein P [Shewanella surugensis]|uniref:Replication protein P n=1 Tax=Shewanella surugensis TaxID=212020 RepID=A0ABT0L8V5_9GAMM|nr:replication protein P [Shewanella surugensis]MCL1124133.1 replication protein P [Shewanella surugensis]